MGPCSEVRASAWLLLHGFSGGPESFHAVEADLSGTKFLAPHLLGHGEPPTPSAHSFEDEVDRLARLCRAHFAQSVDLLGYSLGARLGLGLLLRHPDLFRSAVLVGVNPGLETEPERHARRASDFALAQKLAQDNDVGAFVEHWERLPLFASQQSLPRAVLERQARLRRSHSAAGLGRALQVLGLGSMPNFWPSLVRVDQPLTLVVGEYDLKFRNLAQAMIQSLPRARLEIIPGAGHNVVLEAPLALTEVLARHRGALP